MKYKGFHIPENHYQVQRCSIDRVIVLTHDDGSTFNTMIPAEDVHDAITKDLEIAPGILKKMEKVPEILKYAIDEYLFRTSNGGSK